jgi:CubicO group peptidase (beta-lactamase class C family)
VGRILRYGETDIDDFSHYPGRALQPAGEPYHLARGDERPLLPPSQEEQLDRILEGNDTIAFLIVQGDAVRYERYFQGHGPAALSQLFSVSKSVTSILVGMAIEDGYLAGVDQPVTDLVPELADRGFAGATLGHLLTMTSGSSYLENNNAFGRHVILNYTPRLERQILQFEAERPPGELWRYKSGDNALLALALDRALGGETIADYTQRRLWTPLGMEDPAVWSLDHEGDGLEKTWCCLATSPRDLAKVGRFVLDRGAWQGQQLLSAGWIEQSTSAQVPESALPGGNRESRWWWNYGYQWWLASEEERDFAALGLDGQILYLHPGKDLIVVRLGWSGGDLSNGEWVSLFNKIAQEVE